jgi:hypothetical protein
MRCARCSIFSVTYILPEETRDKEARQQIVIVSIKKGFAVWQIP